MELILGLDGAAEAASREISPVALAAVAAAGGVDGFHATFRLERGGAAQENTFAGIRAVSDRPIYVETIPSISSIRPVLSLRPDVVILGPERKGDRGAVIDPTLSATGLESAMREARNAGLQVFLRVAAELASIRTVHRLGAKGVALPPTCLEVDRDAGAARDAIEESLRAAVKLRLKILIGPVDSLSSLSAGRELAPSAGIVLGPGILERAALLGLGDALRLARERVGS